MCRRVNGLLAAVAFVLLGKSGSPQAAPLPVIAPLGAVLKVGSVPLETATNVRVLGEGSLLVDERSKSSLLLIDSALATSTVVMDQSTAATRRYRGDFHIEWIAPDGVRSSSARLPSQRHRLSDPEKIAMVDSLTRCDEAHPSAWGAVGMASRPSVISYPAIADIADYAAPFAPNGVMADVEGNLWIRVVLARARIR